MDKIDMLFVECARGSQKTFLGRLRWCAALITVVPGTLARVCGTHYCRSCGACACARHSSLLLSLVYGQAQWKESVLGQTICEQCFQKRCASVRDECVSHALVCCLGCALFCARCHACAIVFSLAVSLARGRVKQALTISPDYFYM